MLYNTKFRYLNEQLYTVKSSEAWNLFQEDPQSFVTYHKGFENQIAKWPVNPLDVIIQKLKKELSDL
jgi:ribosomal RNA-processing protein 8